MINPVQPILNKNLPMSLLPRQSLLSILENVRAEKSCCNDRLSLAIPVDEMICFNESRLLRDVIGIDQGVVMQIASPSESKQPAFTNFRSIVVLMLQPERDLAIKWKIEAAYVAI